MEVSLPAEPARVSGWHVVVDVQTGAVADLLVVSASAVPVEGDPIRSVQQLHAFPDERGVRKATLAVPDRGFELEKGAEWTVAVLLPVSGRLLEASDDPSPEVTSVAGRTVLSWSGAQDPDLSWVWDTFGGR